MLHRAGEVITQAIIYLMVIFGPWAFGTTQGWSIWTMNIAAYLLGVLCVLRHAIVKRQPYLRSSSEPTARPLRAGCTWGLGLLTLSLLFYCFTSALNARATFEPPTASFTYHDCIGWLPHSFDSHATWFAFWTYLGLACAFWSIRDWLLAQSTSEQMPAYNASGVMDAQRCRRGERKPTSARLNHLLTLLTVNGGFLAAEGIIQRLTQSPRLLFVVLPHIHQTAITQFGPYAYRANATEYLNLLWPVGLGFWWMIRKEAPPRLRGLLLSCVAIMAVASIISGSKAGILVCAALLFLSSLLLLMVGLARNAPGTPARRKSLISSVLIVGALGLVLGWNELRPGLAGSSASIERRERIYEVARQMRNEFGVFGSGPGTYQSVSELYRPCSPGFWPAQVHNDWLETRLTFGIPGSVLILTALVIVLSSWFMTGGVQAECELVLLSWLALAGCLAHASVDFPFQIHSILFLFVVVSAMLSTLSRSEQFHSQFRRFGLI